MPVTADESVFRSSAIGAIVSVPFADSGRDRVDWSLEFEQALSIAHVLVQVNAFELDAGLFRRSISAGTGIAAETSWGLVFRAGHRFCSFFSTFACHRVGCGARLCSCLDVANTVLVPVPMLTCA